ncbi:hypothetical protein H5T55_04045 [Candidatus Bipolaricaulota bacterium]|nr:hypothetical protein [Candidatus Bipolaricaulota bacterium]
MKRALAFVSGVKCSSDNTEKQARVNQDVLVKAAEDRAKYGARRIVLDTDDLACGDPRKRV